MGDNIVKRRTALHLSQKDMMKELQKIGCSPSRNTMSKIENGKPVRIDLEFLKALCEVLNCDIGYLLGEYEHSTKSIQAIHEYTGLSEDSIDFLHRQGPDMGEKRILSTLVSAYGMRIAIHTVGLMVELMKYEETAPSFAGSATEKVFAENTLYRIHERSAAIDSAVSDWVDSITDRQSIIEKIKKVT